MFGFGPLREPGEGIAEASKDLLRAMLEQNRLKSEDTYRQQQIALNKQKEAREAELSPIYKSLYSSQALLAESKAKQNEYINSLFKKAMSGEGGSLDQNSGMDLAATLRGHPPQISIHGGYQWIYNPLTGQTRRGLKVEETPSEKREAEIKTKGTEEENKKNIALKSNIEKGLPALQSAWDTANLLKLLFKQTHSTGPIAGRMAEMGFSTDKMLGVIDTLTGKLQADISKFATARPGVGSLKWAEKVKPSTKKQSPYNLGMTEGVLFNLGSDYENENKLYKTLTGKDLGKLSKYAENDPLLLAAVNAIKHNVPIDVVMERLRRLREGK